VSDGGQILETGAISCCLRPRGQKIWGAKGLAGAIETRYEGVMDVELVSDQVTPEGRTMVADVRGDDGSVTHAVVEYLRRTWGAPDKSHDVFGDGENLDDGVVRWTFRFGDRPDNEFSSDEG
jgi:hypothetical protein